MPETEPIGYVSFILHAHFPYLRQAGRWPHGEEALHKAIAEAYVPLLTVLSDFAEARLPVKITLAASPILLEQLADLVVQKHAVISLEAAVQRAADDIARWQSSGQDHLAYLARFYVDWYECILGAFEQRFGRNLVTVLRALVDQGIVEPFSGTATHCYLPRITELPLIRAQLKLGAATTIRHLGKAAGVWLPELCYRRGLREYLAEPGLPTIVLESLSDDSAPPPQPVWGDMARSMRVLFRDRRSVLPVISSSAGYPGDFLYREFYRYDVLSGLHYWRVTGPDVPLAEKALYDPYHALSRAQEHAHHYVGLIEQRLRSLAETCGKPGLLVIAFDAELFGHGWFEGSTWLRLVLQQLALHPEITLTTTSEYLERYPPQQVAIPDQSYSSWDHQELQHHWERLNGAASQMSALARAYPDAGGDRERCLNQAARELLLASASDWAALVATGRAPAYARQRFDEHLARFAELVTLAQVEHLNDQQCLRLAELEELDNPFPLLNYRIFEAGD